MKYASGRMYSTKSIISEDGLFVNGKLNGVGQVTDPNGDV